MTKRTSDAHIDPSTSMHLCVDMQRLFADNSDWAIPWLPRILPNVVRVARAMPGRTIFTRFIPASSPGDAAGAWQGFYKKWRHLTLEHIAEDMLEIVEDIRACTPAAPVIDKRTYSPWHFTDLADRLRRADCESVIVTGGETDMCVLATVLGAVDLGYKAIVVTDAICSSVDETHDAVLKLYRERFAQQIGAMTCDEFIAALKEPAREC